MISLAADELAFTPRQAEMLRELRRGRHVYGAEVRVVRSLVAMGLADLIDDGCMHHCGRVDGERWTARLTSEGHAWARAAQGVA